MLVNVLGFVYPGAGHRLTTEDTRRADPTLLRLTVHDFERRVVETVVSQLPARSDLDYSVRTTPGGRHIALTLDITVQNAEQVRAIYAEVRELEGLTLLF